MRSALVALVLLAAAGVWLSVGTLDPCEMLRKELRAEASREGGLASVVSVLPDSVIDAFVERQWGRMTPISCINWMMQPPDTGPVKAAPMAASAPPASATRAAPQRQVSKTTTPPMPPPELLRQASIKAATAIASCRNRRLSGELRTYVSSAECSGPIIFGAYQEIYYPYLDLVSSLVSERRRLADLLDKRMITEQQAQTEDQTFGELLEREVKRRSSGILQ
jgi:hypothetical protein